jgi:hypothetical protein
MVNLLKDLKLRPNLNSKFIWLYLAIGMIGLYAILSVVIPSLGFGNNSGCDCWFYYGIKFKLPDQLINTFSYGFEPYVTSRLSFLIPLQFFTNFGVIFGQYLFFYFQMMLASFAIYCLLVKFFSRNTAIIGFLFFALNPVLIGAASAEDSIMIAVGFGLWGIYFFSQALLSESHKRQKIINYFLSGVFLALTCHSLIYALFIYGLSLIPLFFWALFFRKKDIFPMIFFNLSGFVFLTIVLSFYNYYVWNQEFIYFFHQLNKVLYFQFDDQGQFGFPWLEKISTPAFFSVAFLLFYLIKHVLNLLSSKRKFTEKDILIISLCFPALFYFPLSLVSHTFYAHTTYPKYYVYFVALAISVMPIILSQVFPKDNRSLKNYIFLSLFIFSSFIMLSLSINYEGPHVFFKNPVWCLPFILYLIASPSLTKDFYKVIYLVICTAFFSGMRPNGLWASDYFDIFSHSNEGKVRYLAHYQPLKWIMSWKQKDERIQVYYVDKESLPRPIVGCTDFDFQKLDEKFCKSSDTNLVFMSAQNVDLAETFIHDQLKKIGCDRLIVNHFEVNFRDKKYFFMKLQ